MDRHHRRVASTRQFPGSKANLRWRPPRFPAIVGLHTPTPPRAEEDASGKIHRTGPAWDELHLRRNRAERSEVAPRRGGDQRRGAGELPAKHSRQEASVPGGRDAQRLAVRDSFATRRGDRGRRHQREPWTEERRAGCIPTCRGVTHRDDQDTGVQGTAAVPSVARARTRAFDAGAGRSAGAGATESDVPRAGHRHAGQERLQPERARPVAEAITRVLPAGPRRNYTRSTTACWISNRSWSRS